MTCTRSLLLVLAVAGCLNPDTDLSTSTLVEVTGDSSSSSSEGIGSSSGSADTTSGTTGFAPCDEDPACGPGEDLDSCPSQCSVCGDGVRSGAEVCDNGSENRTYWPAVPPDGACGEGCTLALEWCGDAAQNGVESCDNGLNADAPYHDQGTPPADACAPGCLPVEYCGDGLENGPGEDCDEGGEAATCDADCTTAVCGDGTVNAAAGEVCDDGNVEDADNCSADCLFVQRRVFVSSVPYKGDMNFAVDNDAKLTGIDLADARCQKLAVAAGLAGKYKAWLSDDRRSPAQRFDTKFAGRYRLLSAVNNIIATGWADLTDGELARPIAADQTGVQTDENVWTDTLADGTSASDVDHCEHWTKTIGTTTIGQSSAFDLSWTNLVANQVCSNALRIYCFEDP